MEASTSMLPPEIVSMVLDLIYEEDHSSIPPLRFVSRMLNWLATPLTYKRWLIRTDDLDWPGSEIAIANIREYTRHAIYRNSMLSDPEYRNVDWNVILERFQGLPRLEKITWDMHPKSRFTRFPIPMEVVRPEVELAIQNFQGIDRIVGDFRIALATIPSKNLVSLKTPRGLEGGFIPLPVGFVLEGSKIHTLQLSLGAFTLSAVDNCSTLKTLVLSGGWGSRETMAKYSISPKWNLRQLRFLELAYVPIETIMSRIDLDDLAGLRTLKISERSSAAVHDWAPMFSKMLKHIEGLTEFILTADMNRLSLDYLLEHAGSLRRLRLRDFTVLNRRPCSPPLHLIEGLSNTAIWLESFEFDLQVLGQDWRRFLPALSNFQSLRQVTIHVMPLRPRTFPRDVETQRSQYYADLKFAQEVVLYLATNKKGKPFEQIEVYANWFCSAPWGRNSSPRLRIRCYYWDKSVVVGAADFVKQNKEKGSKEMLTWEGCEY